MSQTSYSASMSAGIAGAIANGGETSIRSFAAEETLEFGVYVTKGTDPEKQVKLPTDPTHVTDLANFGGIVVRDHLTENNLLSTTEIAQYDPVAVLESGDIFVQIDATVTVDDPVFVRVVAGATEQLGAFRNDADGGDAVELPNARFVKGGTSGGVAAVRITF